MITVEQAITEYTAINIIVTDENWDEALTYNFNDVAFDEHYYYISVIDGNIGLKPTDNRSQWLRSRVSNRYAQIDLQALTFTICDVDTKVGGLAPYDLISEFQNNRYDTLALGGVHASGVKIEILNNLSEVIWSDITNLSKVRPEVHDWYTYYFTTLPQATEVVAQNFFYRLPSYDNTHTIRVTLDEKDGRSACAYMVAGNSQYIGCTQHGVGMGLEDFSHKEVDDFGVLELTKRDSRQTMDLDLVFSAYSTQRIKRVVRDTMGKVVLFVADESDGSIYEHLLMLAYIEDYTAVLSDQYRTQASLSISEVI